MEKAKTFFEQNKKVIIGVVVVGLAIYLYKKHGWRLQRIVSPSAKNNSPESVISDTRKEQIEEIAGKLYTDIYETAFWTGHDYAPYEKALSLFDNEIIYLAKYYKSHLSDGLTLWEDIDSQWYTWGDSPAKLQVKLSELGQK